MNRPRILMNGRLLPQLEAVLAERYEMTSLSQQGSPDAFLAQHGAKFAGLVTSAKTGATAGLINALPALEVLSVFGVGYDAVDVAAAHARGIPVGYTPEVLNDCVADTAMGLLIDVARKFSASDRHVRQGLWPKAAFPLATRVSGKRLGIVGLGRIGQTIARRASGFDMDIRYHNRRERTDVSFVYEPSLQALAEWCDFLMIASAGGAETRHLISMDVLKALGPKGFLVNISRGSVLDEMALVEALEQGVIAGAGLDVYDDEPHVPERLRQLDQAVLFPHIASATHETRQAMADLVLDNLETYFATGHVKVAVPGGPA
ncbi:MAG: 2-hydroxyacid dehydrogenase [Pseudomonadota bacterium]